MKRLRLGNGAATNSVLLTFVQVITTLLGLIVTKLLSVNFSLEEYGTYSQALLVTTTVTSLSILGLTNATNYFYNRTSDETQQEIFLSTIFTIQYVVGTICGILVIVFRGGIAQYFANDRLKNILIIVAFTPFLTNLIQMYQTLFVSIGKAKVIAIRNLFVSLIRLITVIIACYVLNNIVTVLMVILGLDIIQVAYFSILFTKYRHPIRIKNARSDLISEILHFSIPMAIYVLTNSLSRDIDKYVVSAFSNTETLAIYTNAAKVLPFDMLTASLITVLVPIITRYINSKQHIEAQKVFKLYLRVGYILTCTFVGGAIAVSKQLMLFLYDTKYLVGLPIFIVYLFIDMIRFANVTTILSGAGKTRILMSISVSMLLANSILNVIAFKTVGLIGPALVTLILTMAMTLVLLHFGAREIKCTIKSLFDFKEIGLIAFEILAFGIGAHFLSNALMKLGVSYVINLIISYGMYIIAMCSANSKRIIGCLKALNAFK